MRGPEQKLICEVCIASFDFTYEEFLSRSTLINMYAGAVNLYHDEDIATN